MKDRGWYHGQRITRVSQPPNREARGGGGALRKLSHAGQAPVLGADDVMHAVQRDALPIVAGGVVWAPRGPRIHIPIVDRAHPLQAAVQTLPPAEAWGSGAIFAP